MNIIATANKGSSFGVFLKLVVAQTDAACSWQKLSQDFALPTKLREVDLDPRYSSPRTEIVGFLKAVGRQVKDFASICRL